MTRPMLRAISPDASEEEVAAIVAAIAASSGGGAAPTPDPHLDEWMRAARLVSRRVGRVRGPWRFSGRVARRTRP
ncbi:MAG: hypothetical protein FJW86_00325 [Actinobacteria bacterium]|nr:hypothetical protein [Actinomycetota bacterium]